MPGSKHIYLGLYNKEEAAARAYDRALVRLRGPNAATNYALANYKPELQAFQNDKVTEKLQLQLTAVNVKVLQAPSPLSLPAPPLLEGGAAGSSGCSAAVAAAGGPGATVAAAVECLGLVKVEMKKTVECVPGTLRGNVLEKDKEGKKKKKTTTVGAAEAKTK